MTLKINYDKAHDVLYIFVGPPKLATDEEILPNVYLRRAEDNNQPIGLIVMDFKNVDFEGIRDIIPFDLDFENIRTEFIK